MKSPLVSINIVTFNAQLYIKKALESIVAQTYPRIEVNILDNNSQDGTPKIIEKISKNLGLPVTCYMLYENTGFAKGHNILINKGRGEYILLLNQDAWLDSKFVAIALELFAKDDTIGALQPKIYRYNFQADSIVMKGDKPVIDATGLVMLKNRRVIARGQGQADKGQFDNEQEVFGADGAVPIFRKTALEDVKIPTNSFEYFDEDFFMYKEDVDLSWRLRLYGWKIMYNPRLLAYHARGSGESAGTNYLDIVSERKHISPLAKSLSWRNQRLMQVKNEIPSLYIRHLPWIFFKELASFFYIIFFERYALTSMKEFFVLLPNAWRKRTIIMARRKASAAQLLPWFQ